MVRDVRKDGEYMDLYNLVLSAKITKGEGGGDEPTGIKEISITQNGVTIEDVKSYASAKITTSVPVGVFPSGTKQISSNGSYDVSNFASAAVNISPIIQSLSISENGTYSVPSGVDGYNPITVNVSGGGGGGGNHDAEDGMVTRALSEYSNSRVTTIGEYAFAACSNLTTANFPNVVSIYASAFQSCSGLTTISIPQATVISNNAFANCSSLTTANFPNVTNVGSYAFYCCSRLTTVSFPNVTNVGSYAFYNCSSLTAVSFPNATSINEYAFYGCNKLNTLNIPNAITIGNAAFQNCRSLTTASLPKITSILGTAFRSCSILTSVYILASSIVSLGSASAFASTPMWSSTYTGSWGSIYVPASLVDSYKSAKNWSAYAERITAYTE